MQARSVTSTHPIRRFAGDEQSDAKGFVLGFDNADADPFLMMAEDHFGPDKGFDWHPHRGIETVTLILDGQVAHADNAGGAGLLGPGDVQWMTAGRGLVHREMAPVPSHTLQLWVNLPAARKLVEPGYQDLGGDAVAVREEGGARFRVFSGRSGPVVGPARNQHPIFFGDLRLDAGAGLDHDLDPAERFVAVVVEGRATVGGTDLVAGEVAIGDPQPGAATLRFASTTGGRLVVFHGRPLEEPVVQYGPFVMNTEDEIRQAILDYRSGAFGPIPAYDQS
jgi:redox-sensitive bicupin YhaK (pirin superfamily)